MIRLTAAEHFTRTHGCQNRDLYLEPGEIESIEAVEIRTNDYGTNNHSGSRVTTKTGQQFLVLATPRGVAELVEHAHTSEEGT